MHKRVFFITVLFCFVSLVDAGQKPGREQNNDQGESLKNFKELCIKTMEQTKLVLYVASRIDFTYTDIDSNKQFTLRVPPKILNNKNKYFWRQRYKEAVIFVGLIEDLTILENYLNVDDIPQDGYEILMFITKNKYILLQDLGNPFLKEELLDLEKKFSTSLLNDALDKNIDRFTFLSNVVTSKNKKGLFLEAKDKENFNIALHIAFSDYKKNNTSEISQIVFNSTIYKELKKELKKNKTSINTSIISLVSREYGLITPSTLQTVNIGRKIMGENKKNIIKEKNNKLVEKKKEKVNKLVNKKFGKEHFIEV